MQEMHERTLDKTTEIVKILEPNQPVEIIISLPQKFIFNHITSIQAVYEKVSELTPIIAVLAQAAFAKEDKNAWDTIQALLYYWNYRDLTRVQRIQDNTALVECALRKAVLDQQAAYLSNASLECVTDFTPARAVAELADKAQAHRINTHPLLEEMATQGLRAACVRTFLENYYVNNRVFHLFIIALALSAPLARRTELANNFYDELGSGDTAMAHPVLFFKNFNTIGKPTKIIPLPESLHLVNEKMYTAFLSGDYHYGMGGFGYIELTMPNQMRKILSGLEKSGLPRADLEFWEAHITIDEMHGKTWFDEMLHLIETPEQAQKCLAGGMRLLDARAAMYDGILRFL